MSIPKPMEKALKKQVEQLKGAQQEENQGAEAEEKKQEVAEEKPETPEATTTEDKNEKPEENDVQKQEEPEAEKQEDDKGGKEGDEPKGDEEEGLLSFTEDDLGDLVKADDSDSPQGSELTTLAKEIGLEDAKDTTEIKEYVSGLQNKVKELTEAQEKAWANEAIKKANELAKDGADWETWLGLNQLDYSSLSDLEAGKHTLLNSGYDHDAIAELEETASGKLTIEREGKQAKSRAEEMRKQKMKEIEAVKQQKEQERQQAIEEQKKAQQQLHNDLVAGIDKMKGGEFEGIKMPDTYWDSLKRQLTSGQGVMSMLLDGEGKPSIEKIIRLKAQSDLFPKIKERLATANQNSGKRQVLDNLRNTDLAGKPTKNTGDGDQEPIGNKVKEALLQRHRRPIFNKSKKNK